MYVINQRITLANSVFNFKSMHICFAPNTIFALLDHLLQNLNINNLFKLCFQLLYLNPNSEYYSSPLGFDSLATFEQSIYKLFLIKVCVKLASEAASTHKVRRGTEQSIKVFQQHFCKTESRVKNTENILKDIIINK